MAQRDELLERLTLKLTRPGCPEQRCRRAVRVSNCTARVQDERAVEELIVGS
jgi:hypothetical protein